jgi:hypothetical protein
MRLSNIFEAPALTPSPEMGMNPAPKPGSTAAAAAVSGANAMRGVTHQSGSAVAKALGALGSGKTLTPGLAKALDPYADALTTILSDPQLRSKFVQLMKQAQKQEPAQESVTEDQDSVDAVASSITRRIMMQHTDLLSKYGPVKVMAAIDDVAEFAGGDGLDEIGSSDVSIWTKQVIQDLEAGHYDRVQEDEQLDEILPALGAIGRAVVGTGSAIASGIVSGVGHVAGTMAQDALDDSDEDPTDDASNGDEVDTVTMDVPLLLRVLEFAREEVQEDMDLHDLAERLIAMSKDGPLSMDDYDSIVGSVEELPAPDSEPVDEVSNKTLSSYTDKAAKERDAYHADRNKDAESARKYHNRKAGVRKALSITQEDEQLDELSPQTLGSYVSKSVKDEKERRAHGIRVRDELRAATGKNFGTPIDRKLYSPTASRAAGQKRAIDKLTGKSKVPAQEGYYTPGPETMPGAVGPQETTTVSFNQSKQMGDATLNINASAKDMEELHRILKLAGIDYASDSGKQEPNMQDVAVALEPHAPEAPAEEPCGCQDEEMPTDVKYNTDKQTLINVLRDKLQKRLA